MKLDESHKTCSWYFVLLLCQTTSSYGI